MQPRQYTIRASCRHPRHIYQQSGFTKCFTKHSEIGRYDKVAVLNLNCTSRLHVYQAVGNTTDKMPLLLQLGWHTENLLKST